MLITSQSQEDESSKSGIASHPKPPLFMFQNTLCSLNGHWFPKALNINASLVPICSEGPISQLSGPYQRLLLEIEVQLGFPFIVDESRLYIPLRLPRVV